MGELPLHGYCEHRTSISDHEYDLEVYLVRTLVGLYPEGVHKVNTYGYSPLHSACEKATPADLTAIEFLVESMNGSEARQDDHGQHTTPLHVACESKAAPEVIHFLIQALPGSVRALGGGNTGSTSLHELCHDDYCHRHYADYVPQIQ